MEKPNSYTLNVNGRLLDLSSPLVMGILNVTPDSFYDGSRTMQDEAIARRADEIIQQGGGVIDVGAFSTRPGANEVTEEEEMQRLRRALQIIRKCQPQAVLSVDTFRPAVAKMAVEEFGVAIINDVSEGTGTMAIPPQNDDTDEMFRMVAALGVPYVLMSVRPDLEQTLKAFACKVDRLRALGVKDIILDPGFGFGKTLDQNYALLAVMERLQVMQLPLLVGVSRKSMAYRLLGCSPAEALNATTVLHTIALEKGASILRVHDVREAVEVCTLVEKMKSEHLTPNTYVS
ncbi:MAG: dihydropteroate synthase [Prevotella sp.]|nr:dihydropteroate synthase [Prevotella sp.]